MALATTNEILAQMAAQIRSALGSGYQVEPHHVAAASPPTVDMYPGDIAKGVEAAAFGAEGELFVTVRVRVNGNDDLANEELLNDLMEDWGDLSVAQALDDDETLNGLATSIGFSDITGLTLYSYGADVLPGRQFTVTVIRALT
jgi:hypothetical protein